MVEEAEVHRICHVVDTHEGMIRMGVNAMHEELHLLESHQRAEERDHGVEE